MNSGAQANLYEKRTKLYHFFFINFLGLGRKFYSFLKNRI